MAAGAKVCRPGPIASPVAEAARAYDLTPSEIEDWVDQGKARMENARRAKPEDIRDQYEAQLKTLQEAHGEAMLELRAQKNGTPCWRRRTRNDPSETTGLGGRGFCRVDFSAMPLVQRSRLTRSCVVGFIACVAPT